MYGDTLTLLAERSVLKRDFAVQRPLGYLISAILAGLYMTLSIILVFTVSAPFAQVASPAVKLLMGVTFGIALTLIIFAGSELFTGNNLVMAIGYLHRRVTVGDVLRIWGLSFLGNFIGAAVTALVYVKSALPDPVMADFITDLAMVKMTAPFGQLFLRAVLCNILVCLALWMVERAKEEVTRIFLIWWALFAFVGSGYEHSVANMSLLSIAILLPRGPEAVTLAGFAANMIPVTIGNIIGGAVILAGAYHYISPAPALAGPEIKPEE